MVAVTRDLAERIASVADLVLTGDDADLPLQQLTELSVELIPSGTCAGVVAPRDAAWAYAQSDESVAGLHRLQMESGSGPVADGLRFGEARRIDDVATESRWPETCAAMADRGLRSCLVLPLRTDRAPGAVLALYSTKAEAFAGADHDIALLLAAEGGVAVRNAGLYSNCRTLVGNLHIALASRAVIEQAKGILVAEYGCPPDTAFARLSAMSQNSNRKLKDIAADLVEGRITRSDLAPEEV